MKIQFIGATETVTGSKYWSHGHDKVNIHGKYVPVNAEVHNLEALSSHGNYQQIINWLKAVAEPKKTFITHGKTTAADAMRGHFKEQLGWDDVLVPEYLDSFEL